MSSRRTKQWPGRDWSAAPGGQHQQYGSQGVDQITQGISDVSLQTPHYVHGNGVQDVPYDGQYYQPNPYAAYPQQEAYPSQENTYPPPGEAYIPQEEPYAQPDEYPGEASGGPQYSQDNQYDYQNMANTDPNSQYTLDPRQQQYSAQTNKGKSRLADSPSYNKPRGSRDKNRERDKKPPPSKQNRQKPGKDTAEDDEISPFYNSRSVTQESPDQTADPEDSQSFEPEGIAASDPTSGYDDHYTTAPPISDEQQLTYDATYDATYDDPQVQEDLSAYDPYADSNYVIPENAGPEPGSRRHHRDPPALPDIYQPDITGDDLESAIAEANGYIGAGTSSLLEDASIEQSMGQSADYGYQYEDGGGLQTPRAGTPRATTLATLTSTVGQAELDNRFTVEHSSRFSAGEVFKVLWSEPLGDKANMTDAETRSHLGERFYVGIRRFIIVRTDEGHSTCVPILTYERRACTKRGVKPRTHGIIYAFGRPKPLDNEPKLGCPPVRIDLDYPTERIVKESRVNYSKLVTVEHNIKVFFIGRIATDHLGLVNESVDKCWENKAKAPKDHSNRRQQRDYRDHRSYR